MDTPFDSFCQFSIQIFSKENVISKSSIEKRSRYEQGFS